MFSYSSALNTSQGLGSPTNPCSWHTPSIPTGPKSHWSPGTSQDSRHFAVASESRFFPEPQVTPGGDSSAFPRVQTPSRCQLNSESTSFPDPRSRFLLPQLLPNAAISEFQLPQHSCPMLIPAHLHLRDQLLSRHRINPQIPFFSRPALP